MPEVPSPKPRRTFAIAGALLAIAGLSLTFLMTSRHGLMRDRWHREDLEQLFPAGEASEPLLLVNSGSVPAFAEVRCKDWGEPRIELLLPGQSQFLNVPAPAGHPAQVGFQAIDMQGEGVVHVVQLPPGQMTSLLVVEADGHVSLSRKQGGDSSPPRGYVGVDTEYALPVRVDVPFDLHERPRGDDYERRAWIGPGMRWDSAHCAYALSRTPSVTVWVPRRTEFERRFEIAAGDGATRLVMKSDGTVERDDVVPPWRRVAAHLASF